MKRLKPILVFLPALAILLSGCLGGQSGPLSSAPEVPIVPPSFKVNYTWDGQMHRHAGVHAGPICLGDGHDVGSFNLAGLNGSVQALDLKVTWSASSAFTEKLIVEASKNGYADACSSSASEEPLGSATGPSPLSLKLDHVNSIQKDKSLDFSVSHPGDAVGPATVWVNLDQSFHVEGTITVLPWPPGTSQEESKTK